MKRGETASNDLARLQGARFVVASETGAGRSLNEAVIKQTTGSDTITARFLFQEFFEFRPAFKLWLATNYKPTIRGTDLAIWRRIRLIPFEVTIPLEEQDPHLPEKLREELPGIMTWAVRGCQDWLANGLGAPEEVTAATDSYRDEQDLLGPFLEERCILLPSESIKTTELKKAYQTWAEENGEKPISRNLFANLIQGRGCTPSKSHGLRTWKGLTLK